MVRAGFPTPATLVFTAAQGLLAARAGASSILAPVGQLDLNGHDGVRLVGEIRAVLDVASSECDLIALYPASATQFATCATLGADGAAVTADVLRSLLVHPLTDRGVDQLLNELAKQHRAWTTL
jgi:transaldolase